MDREKSTAGVCAEKADGGPKKVNALERRCEKAVSGEGRGGC